MKIKTILIISGIIVVTYSCQNKNRNKQAEENSTNNTTDLKNPSDSLKFEKSLALVKSFEDLVIHFKTYEFKWKSTGLDWDVTIDGLMFFDKSSKSGFIKKIPENEMLQFINDLPNHYDLRGIVFDLWKAETSKK